MGFRKRNRCPKCGGFAYTLRAQVSDPASKLSTTVTAPALGWCAEPDGKGGLKSKDGYVALPLAPEQQAARLAKSASYGRPKRHAGAPKRPKPAPGRAKGGKRPAGPRGASGGRKRGGR